MTTSLPASPRPRPSRRKTGPSCTPSIFSAGRTPTSACPTPSRSASTTSPAWSPSTPSMARSPFPRASSSATRARRACRACSCFRRAKAWPASTYSCAAWPTGPRCRTRSSSPPALPASTHARAARRRSSPQTPARKAVLATPTPASSAAFSYRGSRFPTAPARTTGSSVRSPSTRSTRASTRWARTRRARSSPQARSSRRLTTSSARAWTMSLSRRQTQPPPVATVPMAAPARRSKLHPPAGGKA